MSKLHCFFVLFFYILVRLGLDEILWQKISVYYGYLFELIFVLFTIFIFKPKQIIKSYSTLNSAKLLGLFFFFGAITLLMSKAMHINVPFDLTSIETTLLLLVLAPILEELIFRYSLWEALKGFNSSNFILIFGTSILFSVGHFMSYWIVPIEYKSFVLYQTGYVFFLGCALGYFRRNANFPWLSILLHFGFNLGFYISFQILPFFSIP